MAALAAPRSGGNGLIKVALVGGVGVGKTSLVERLCDGAFRSIPNPTCGVSFRMLRALPVDQRAARMHIWDLSGDPRYALVSDSYLRSVQAIILCYDTSRVESLSEMQDWLQKVRTFAPVHARLILCGTKHEASSTEREAGAISQSAAAIASGLGIPWVLTSAKTGVGVQEVFTMLVRSVRKDASSISTRCVDNVLDSHATVRKASAAAIGASIVKDSPYQVAHLSCPVVAARWCGDACSRLVSSSLESQETEAHSANPTVAVSSQVVEERSGGLVERGDQAPTCRQQVRA